MSLVDFIIYLIISTAYFILIYRFRRFKPIVTRLVIIDIFYQCGILIAQFFFTK